MNIWYALGGAIVTSYTAGKILAHRAKEHGHEIHNRMRDVRAHLSVRHQHRRSHTHA